jgi:mannose-6-phosphate isomerase-like protein (cupin superfamily)
VNWGVVRGTDVEYRPSPHAVAAGYHEATMMDAERGAAHLEVALVRLDPGGSVAGHVHPFEESFYVLEGEVLFTVAERSYRLGPDDFGFAPVSTTHAWHNAGNTPVRWLRTRSPRSRHIGDGTGTYLVAGVEPPVDGDEIVQGDRARRFVGHYDDAIMPEPAALAMKGFRSPGPTNVAVWMLVDEMIGAAHHTKFAVRFDPTGATMTLGGQHFHPFEETYFITDGAAVAHLEDQAIEVGVGDLVFAGVGALHGFTNPGTTPVRWIEMQAPNPPPEGAFFFAGDWS